MSEENKDSYSPDEVQAMIAEAVEKEVLGLKAKNEELLSESKKYKSTAQQLEEAQRAKEEQRAKEQGEYKHLFESKEKELEELRASVESERKRVEESEKNRAVLGIAADLVKSDERKRKTLEHILKDHVSYAEGVSKFLLNGQEVAQGVLIDHLKSAYDFLIDGSPAKGDGALGGGGTKTKSFKEMTMTERAVLANTDPVRYQQLAEGN